MRALIVLLSVGVLTGCTRRSQVRGVAPAGPAWTSSGFVQTNRNVSVTAASSTNGRVAAVNAAGRFVVLTFPLGAMPALERRLNVYRNGLKVAEVKITGPQLDINIDADMVAGECRIGDEVRVGE